jgi:hypothetical protein
MSQGERPRTALGHLADAAVFAPLGLAMTFAESVPALAAKARSRLGAQAGTARGIGEFVVAQARGKLAGSASPRVLSSLLGRTRSDRGASAAQGTGPWPGEPPASRQGPRQGVAPAASGPERRWAPAAGQLPIPSYDSLSASQVVQRLAGLSREEVAAVRAYEASNRARATVLAKADQLLKG